MADHWSEHFFILQNSESQFLNSIQKKAMNTDLSKAMIGSFECDSCYLLLKILFTANLFSNDNFRPFKSG